MPIEGSKMPQTLPGVARARAREPITEAAKEKDRDIAHEKALFSKALHSKAADSKAGASKAVGSKASHKGREQRSGKASEEATHHDAPHDHALHHDVSHDHASHDRASHHDALHHHASDRGASFEAQRGTSPREEPATSTGSPGAGKNLQKGDSPQTFLSRASDGKPSAPDASSTKGHALPPDQTSLAGKEPKDQKNESAPSASHLVKGSQREEVPASSPPASQDLQRKSKEQAPAASSPDPAEVSAANISPPPSLSSLSSGPSDVSSAPPLSSNSAELASYVQKACSRILLSKGDGGENASMQLTLSDNLLPETTLHLQRDSAGALQMHFESASPQSLSFLAQNQKKLTSHLQDNLGMNVRLDVAPREGSRAALPASPSDAQSAMSGESSHDEGENQRQGGFRRAEWRDDAKEI